MTQDLNDLPTLIYGTAAISSGDSVPFIAWPGQYYDLEKLPSSESLLFRLYGIGGAEADAVLRFQSLDDGTCRFLYLQDALENSRLLRRSTILLDTGLSTFKLAFWTPTLDPNSATEIYT